MADLEGAGVVASTSRRRGGAMQMNRTHGELGQREPRAVEPPPVVPAADTRWPGGLMVLLIIVALGWPLVTLAAAVPTYLIADREQGMLLAGVGAAVLFLRWALGV
jgi:hypothetical protein